MSKSPQSHDIAVVGMACRFPGECNDADSFWRSLRDGIDAVEEVPKDRWDLEHFYDENPETRGRLYSRHGAFLRQVNEFDADRGIKFDENIYITFFLLFATRERAKHSKGFDFKNVEKFNLVG